MVASVVNVNIAPMLHWRLLLDVTDAIRETTRCMTWFCCLLFENKYYFIFVSVQQRRSGQSRRPGRRLTKPNWACAIAS